MTGFVISVHLDRSGPIVFVERQRSDDRTVVSGHVFSVVQTDGFSGEEERPIVTAKRILAFTGYIANRQDLALNVREGESDGELILRAFEKWGRSFPSHVHGEYSFAILDRETGAVLAGRDALGLHRLVYHCDGRRLWAASNLSLLLSSTGRAPKLDHDACCEFLTKGGLLGSAGPTLFQHVQHLPPAHVLHHDGLGGSAETYNYWQPDLERRLSAANEGDYEEQLRELVFRGVAASLRTRQRVCIELSGGLDSSTVYSAAAVLKAEGTACQLSAYSLCASDTTEADERLYWTAMIERYPMEHRAVDIDKLSDTLEFAAGSQPTFLNAQTWYLEAQHQLAAQLGPHVCLTGQGGDPVFGQCMPPLHLAESLRQLRLGSWLRDLMKWSRRGTSSLAQLLMVHSLGDVQKAFKGPSPPDWLTPGGRERVVESQHNMFRGLSRFVGNPRAVHFHTAAAVATGLPEQDVRAWEFRNPLLNRNLVEFMLGVPDHLKTDADQNRVLQRRALRGLLPDVVIGRSSKGDFTPRFFKGLRRSWAAWEPLTWGTRLGDLGLLDPAAFRHACIRLREGQAGPQLSFLVAALLLEGWLKSRETVATTASVARRAREACLSPRSTPTTPG